MWKLLPAERAFQRRLRLVGEESAALAAGLRQQADALDRTGVEMEALTGVAAAALSLYDTAKAFDRRARIEGIRLLAKSGGKSGGFLADQP